MTIATLVHGVLARNGILLTPEEEPDANGASGDELRSASASEGAESPPAHGGYPFDFEEIFNAPVDELGRERRDAAARGALLTNKFFTMTVDLMDADVDHKTAGLLIEELTRYRYPGKNLRTAQEDQALLILMFLIHAAAERLEPEERTMVRDPAKIAKYMLALKDGEATTHDVEPPFARLFEVAREVWEDWERLWPRYAKDVHWTQLAPPIVADGVGTPKTRTGKLVAQSDALVEVAVSAGIKATKRRLRKVWRSRNESAGQPVKATKKN